MLSIYDQLLRMAAAIKEEAEMETVTPTRLQTYEEGKLTPLQMGHRIRQEILRNLQIISDGYINRNVDQVKIHDQMLASCSGFIYGSAMDTHLAEIIEFNGGEDLKSGSMVTAPRRYGKTETLVMFYCALLVSCPTCEVLCIANSEDACHGLRTKTLNLFENVYGMKKTLEFFLVNNHTHLQLANKNTIHFFSATKGNACTFIFLCADGT